MIGLGVTAFLGLNVVLCIRLDTYLFGFNVTSTSNAYTGQIVCLGALLLFAEADCSVLVEFTTGAVRHWPVDLGRKTMSIQKNNHIMISAKIPNGMISIDWKRRLTFYNGMQS
jgi:hypothetical protein